MIRRVILLTLAAMAVNISVDAGTVYKYHYYKEPQPLVLDPTRVAILAEDDGFLADVGRFGLSQEQISEWAIPGWRIGSVSPEARISAVSPDQGLNVRDLVSQISSADSVQFVSPVFSDGYGLPMFLTPDILVRFIEDVPVSLSEHILGGPEFDAILERDWAKLPRAYRVRATSKNGFDVLALANRLAKMPEVRFAEPNFVFSGKGGHIPNDPWFSLMWALHNTGQTGGTPDMDLDGPEVWDVTTGDDNVVVVVIDTGVQQNHPDIHQITGTDLTNDPDSNGDGDVVNECDNHGTPVAGVVSAIMDNSLGVVGIAPDVRVASARTFISILDPPDCQSGWTSQTQWTVDALAWAESIGAHVTNNSNGYGGSSPAISDKYQQTWEAGIVHFASAGNDNFPWPWFPANASHVAAIGGVDHDGNRWVESETLGSNYNALWFMAPSAGIVTTDRTGNDGWVVGDYLSGAWGTSFSSPYAAGIAAILRSLNPRLTSDEVTDFMLDSCVDLGPPGYDSETGWGFLNAYGAVTQYFSTLIFSDGFESGDLTAWSDVVF